MASLSFLAGLLLAALPTLALAATPSAPQHDRFMLTSDGVRLHMLESGPVTAHTIVFVPGWTMPGWIWEDQIRAFSRHYHVVAFDPRGQGESDVPRTGYEPTRRGEDIADLLAGFQGVPVLVVAWSLGVLDTLAYVHTHGDSLIAGLVLVDNSVGEEPAPLPTPQLVAHRPAVPHLRAPLRPPLRPLSHEQAMRRFVVSMFHEPQSQRWLNRLVQASLHTPQFASIALLHYPLPRTYWRDALYSTTRPVLYVVRPVWQAQALNLELHRPGTQIAIFPHAGHALFVDESARFNTLLDGFIHSKVWP
jgi:microsomal epoxide hydrolase